MPQIFLPPNYSICGYVSRGGYGEVYHCKRTTTDEETGEEKVEDVAVKRIYSFSNRPLPPDHQLKFMRCIFREIVVISHFQNWNEFVELKEIYMSPDQEDIYIVMPLLHSSLVDVLMDSRIREKGMDENVVRYITFQVLTALKLMNAAGCMHRDLSPDNILVDTKKWFSYLADFGLSKAVTSQEQEHTLDVVKQPYRPPEVLLQFSHFDYSKVDVWGLGCVIAELLLGKQFLHFKDLRTQLIGIMSKVTGPPNINAWASRASPRALEFLRKKEEAIHQNCNPLPLREQFPNVSDECIDVLSAMLQFDPDVRASPAQLLEMPWFTNHLSAQIQDQADIPMPGHLPDTENLGKEEMTAAILKYATTYKDGTYVDVQVY